MYDSYKEIREDAMPAKLKVSDNKIAIRPNDIEPFDIRDGRAMVSLGPATNYRYCVYSCPFCYVHSEYLSFQRKSNDEIMEWLNAHRREYDIVYISGDTDSFVGQSRQERTVDLIERLVDLEVEIMITTRAIIKDQYLNRIGAVIDELKSKELNFFGCVSITQFSKPHLEPKPIPAVSDRIDQLCKFKRMGMVSVLAMRPFLPVVPAEDYKQILERTKDVTDIVLGKVWFSDKQGAMYAALREGTEQGVNVTFINSKMDFDENKADWSVYEGKDTEKLVRDICDKNDVAFFMTSRPAVDWARSVRKKTPRVIGIGALNVNFLVKNDESKDELQHREDNSNIGLWDNLAATIGVNFHKHYTSVFLGGGAYHVIECLRHLHAKEHLALDYVGVAGKSIPKVRIEDEGLVSFSVIDTLKESGIGVRYVKESSNIPGITLNKWSGVRTAPKKAIRNNITNPYANGELADFLESEDQDLIVKYLAGADWIHLSSLFDFNAMRKVGGLLTLAKSRNPSMRISWDIGSLNKEILTRKPIVRELLRSSDFVVLSYKELKALAGVGNDETSTDCGIVEKVYTEYRGESDFSLIVQRESFDAVDIYWNYRDSILTRSVKHSHITLKNGPIDITAASAYLSAALIDAKLRPDTAFEMRESIQYGIDLVWNKLITLPEERVPTFKKVRKRFISKLNKKNDSSSLAFVSNDVRRYILRLIGVFAGGVISKPFFLALLASLLATAIYMYLFK